MNVNEQSTDVAPEPRWAADPLGALAEFGYVVAGDLEPWGHSGHLVLLQRLVAPQREAPFERGLFWCETCKLWLLARLADPRA